MRIFPAVANVTTVALRHRTCRQRACRPALQTPSQPPQQLPKPLIGHSLATLAAGSSLPLTERHRTPHRIRHLAPRATPARPPPIAAEAFFCPSQPRDPAAASTSGCRTAFSEGPARTANDAHHRSPRLRRKIGITGPRRAKSCCFLQAGLNARPRRRAGPHRRSSPERLHGQPCGTGCRSATLLAGLPAAQAAVGQRELGCEGCRPAAARLNCN